MGKGGRGGWKGGSEVRLARLNVNRTRVFEIDVLGTMRILLSNLAAGEMGGRFDFDLI